MTPSTPHLAYKAGYAELVKAAGLAEHAPVRGCMTIKPYGFALWENIQDTLNTTFKKKGYLHAYFPLLIPSSFLSKEASHIAGFAKECAVVTHYRVQYDPHKKIISTDPNAQLHEPLIIRPTSEAIIWHTYKNWIQSPKDLPLRIKQSANVMRWEMRPRLFLRSSEILWQEAHTAHATAQEAHQETLDGLHTCKKVIEEQLAIPIILGEKPPHERFSGAKSTYTLEALMQDGKALQAGTSHFLGQNFAKAFDVKFTDKTGTTNHVWGTCWGLTTRLIGAMVMVHADDKGLILPPAIAPTQAIIIPILQYKGKDNTPIINQVNTLQQQLQAKGIQTAIDKNQDQRPGWKFAEQELKGIPLRIVLGLREIQDNQVTIIRRDTHEKITISIDNLVPTVQKLLKDMQDNLYQRALTFQKNNIRYVDDYASFKKTIQTHRGFIMAHWDGTTETAEQINRETKATIRCIPLDNQPEQGKCIYSGKPSPQRVLFAQAY